MARKPSKIFGNECPELLSQWHEIKNKNINPFEIGFKSNKKAWWICPTCKSEYDMSFCNRTLGFSCPYCAGRRVNHTNSLWKTHPHIAKLLKYSDIGNEVTYGSHRKEEFVCDVCCNIGRKQIKSVVAEGLRCSACSDGISYPEKFAYNMLQQLKLNFKKEVTFAWSKGFKKNSQTGEKRYDFYIPNLNLIIETHGKQHFGRGFGRRSLQEEKENDEIKRKLAIENGIKYYVIIDCSISELDFIKNNILNSPLATLFDLEKVDWKLCHKSACNSLVKVVCDSWNSGINSTFSIGNKLNMSPLTVAKYLKQGNLLNWCNYDPDIVRKNKGKILGGRNARKVVQFSIKGDLIRVWDSAEEAGKQLNIWSANIIGVCRGKHKSTGGFRWMYKEDYDKNGIKQIVIHKSIKKVVQLNKKGEFISVWDSITLASKTLGINHSSISLVCHKKKRSAGGYIWFLKEDYEKYIEEKNKSLDEYII